MTIALPPLPYDYAALEPVISSAALKLHHGAHHRGYVDKLNALIAGSQFEGAPLETIVKHSSGAVFNNAAQAWNHAFFWNCLAPGGGKPPPRSIEKRLEDGFGGIEKFNEEFSQAAIECFGSGWAWLVARGDKLEIISTSNAATPITMGATPLLAIDVWEHAYYLDYENRRPEFVGAVIDQLLNWEFAEQQLEKAGSYRKAA